MTTVPQLVARIVELWKTRAGGAYFVRRGAINWTTHDFKGQGRAVAVFVEESPLLPSPGEARSSNVSLGFEVMAIMKTGDGEELNDAVLEALRDDAREVVLGLATSKRADAPDDDLCDVIAAGASISEAYDLRRGVQGVVVSFDVRI